MTPYIIISTVTGFAVAFVDRDDDILVTLSMVAAPVLLSLLLKFNATGADFWPVLLIWVSFLASGALMGWGLGLGIVHYLGRKSR